MARNYNSTSNVNEDRMSRQLSAEMAKPKTSEERLHSLQSYQNTWSPTMSTSLPDFDPMGISTSIRIPSKFDGVTQNLKSYKSKRRNTIPYSSSPLSSSHISSLKEINRFPLEKIPEIVVSPSSSHGNSSDFGASTSKRSHKFVVTRTDANILDK